MVKALQKIIGTSEKDLSRHLLLLKSRAKNRQRAGERFEQGCQVLEKALSPTSSSHAGVEAGGSALEAKLWRLLIQKNPAMFACSWALAFH